MSAPGAVSASGTAPAPDAVTAPSKRPVAGATVVPGTRTVVALASADGGDGIPGCDRNRGRDDGEPGVPARSRAPHDHAPGITGGGPPGIMGRAAAPPLVRLAVQGPEPATPTPVELSVLRV